MCVLVYSCWPWGILIGWVDLTSQRNTMKNRPVAMFYVSCIIFLATVVLECMLHTIRGDMCFVSSVITATTTTTTAAASASIIRYPPCVLEGGGSSSFRLFEDDVVLRAIAARRIWTQRLGVTIEEEHMRLHKLFMEKVSPVLGIVSKNAEELQYPHDHERFAMLGPVGPDCGALLEKYGEGDGEKRACGLKHQLLVAEPGGFVNNSGAGAGGDGRFVIVSIGSHNEWGFEESIFHAMPGCVIHTFDCTVGEEARPPAEIAERVTLHRFCISAVDNDEASNITRIMSWRGVMNMLGVLEPPLFLKMDIEGYRDEYCVEKHRGGGFLLPVQIAFELHYQTSMQSLS